MSLHSHRPASSSRNVDQGTLLRGQACTNCRKRKIRCDGRKPICGQCSRATRLRDPCEYTDPARTRVQILEETISNLEARIQELELQGAEQSAPDIILHGAQDEQGHASGGPVREHGTRYLQPAEASTSTGIFLDLHSLDFTVAERLAGIGSTSSPSVAGGGQLEEPPLTEIESIVDNFLSHASEFGFFLDKQRFRQSVVRPLPMGDHSRPSPALLSTMYLLDRAVSLQGSLSQQEQGLLTFALQTTAGTAFNTHPQHIMHKIQAEVLLSNYFFRNGRFLDARYHASNACTITIGCGLHRIAYASGNAPAAGPEDMIQPVLDPPSDNVEMGERINAFWAVYSLHSVWSAALGTPVSLSFSVAGQIDLPWGLDDDNPQIWISGQMATIQYNNTIQSFLTNSEVPTAAELTIPALFTKASLLFERSANLASRYFSNDQASAEVMTAEFNTLDHLTEAIKHQLPTLEQALISDFTAVRSVVTAHALANAATIKLHAPFTQNNAVSHHRSLFASEAIIHSANNHLILQLGFINPILAIIWPMACQIVIDEVVRLKTNRETWAQINPTEREMQLRQEIETGIQIIGAFAKASPLMGLQLTKIQITYANIGL